MKEKYLLKDEDYIIYKGLKLKRISYLYPFGKYKKEMEREFSENNECLGGYIQSYKNLENRGKSYIGKGSIVCENAKIKDNGIVVGENIISGSIIIKDKRQKGMVKKWNHMTERL